MRIEGLYDLRTLKNLKENDIYDYAFDFRPTSFNFLQQYRFMDLIAQADDKMSHYYLHFSNEADFVIGKFIEDLKSHFKKDTEYGDFENKITLEFSDFCPASFYDSFETPYYWNFHQERPLKEYLDAKYIKGIMLDFNWLHDKHERGEFDSFFAHFLQLAAPAIRERGLELALKIDWDSHLFDSLFDYVDFKFLSLPVNNKIEVCYRNVDLAKASKNIHFYKALRF